MPKGKAAKRSQPQAAPVPRSIDCRPWLGAAVIIFATFVAYTPALRGGFVWDDPDYVVNNHTLRDLGGLAEMWTKPSSIPQWYPMVHTSFWIEYQLWGLRPKGYHIVNVALHVTAAMLLWRLLHKLEVPGAWLAASIFALHPVHVESVAWITERKNVLSAVFYLLAAICYLRSEQSWKWWGASFGLFLAALLSKTVTCSLPAAILLVLWWKHGRLRHRDWIRLIPFFVVGLILAINTALIEKHRVGASGADWIHGPTVLSDFIARCLIAGRAIWFYAAKLVWPVDLAFIYTRWTIDAHDWTQYAYLIGVIALILVLALSRKWIGRAPIVAAMFFIGTLFPALGFFNVYPHRFSFVADHFQYLASIGLTTLIAAALWRIPGHLGAVVLVPLAVLTHLQARIYEDAETLWRDTLAKTPDSWMVWTNLGNALVQRDRFDDAIPYFERALELAPHLHDMHWNVGVGLMRQAKVDEAEARFRRSLEINPNFAPAYESLGKLYLFRRNDVDRAIEYFRKSVELAPYYSQANYGLAVALQRQGNIEEAIQFYRAAVANKLDYVEARYDLAKLLIDRREYDEAIWNLREAVHIAPSYAEAWTNLGAAQLLSGRRDQAVESFRRALRINPNLVPAQRGLQHALQR